MLFSTPSGAGRGLPPLPSAEAAELTPAQRRGLAGLILALHVAGAWGLLQIAAVREVVAQALPTFIDMVAVDAPPVPLAVPPPPPPPTLQKPLPTPTPVPAMAAAPSPAPAAFTVPAEPAPPPVAVPAVVAAQVVVTAPPPLAAPPAPKLIPPSAVLFTEPPAVVYPRQSRRSGEAGLVIVRAYIDTSGVPRQLQIDTSSGHARLDEAALAAVQKSRLKPHTENGQPVEGWARIPIHFELEK